MMFKKLIKIIVLFVALMAKANELEIKAYQNIARRC